MCVKAREENEALKRRSAALQTQANMYATAREQIKARTSDLKASLVNIFFETRLDMFLPCNGLCTAESVNWPL